MPWVTRNNQRYWVGYHDPMGLVVFDPSDQHDLGKDRVRLFVVDQWRVAKFESHIAWERILSEKARHSDEVGPEQVDQALASYLAFVAGKQQQIFTQRHAEYLRPQEGAPRADFSAKYRAAIEASLRKFVNDGDDVVCIGYFVYQYGQCKMCEHVPIKWHYVLENLRSRATLIVGSECIENYQVILSEWGYRPEYLVFPSFLRAYARWILEKNPNAVVFDDGVAMRFQADGGAIMRANSQPSGPQRYRYAQRSQVGGAERVGGVDETGRFYPIGPAVDYDYDAEYAEYEPDPEE